MIASAASCSRVLPRDDAGVYGAVVAAAYQDRVRPDTIVVQDSTPRFDTTAMVLPGEQRIGPANLRTKLMAASEHKASTRSLALPFPVERMAERDAKDRAQSALGGLYIFAFTPVVYSPDRRQAFLYYEVWCGGLCGWGAEALLRRASDGWVIEKQADHWES